VGTSTGVDVDWYATIRSLQAARARLYMTFNVLIKATHYNYMKQLYGFTDEQLLRNHELDDSFVTNV
jgi:hypothetical protein